MSECDEIGCSEPATRWVEQILDDPLPFCEKHGPPQGDKMTEQKIHLPVAGDTITVNGIGYTIRDVSISAETVDDESHLTIKVRTHPQPDEVLVTFITPARDAARRLLRRGTT